ncbi:alcohol dehydrogenase, iron-dependent [Dictyocaulus viviparus]|uniref:Alcohol dehydrogenase, iron-dependent n=1 Tax=Dictyocaulus viviparus TaxID=29172 RepID=A0A0D8XAN0_DICVI|nr:alcohol dehydrogenase, iron-dependent [Dictyocaulus viviparus]
MSNRERYSPERSFIQRSVFTHNEKDFYEARIKKLMLVYGGGSIFSNNVYNDVTENLKLNSITYVDYKGVKPNPETEHTYQGAVFARQNAVDAIIAVGGGSVTDAAKVTAILATNIHAIEHAISALSDVTHGAGLALVTPPYIEYRCQSDQVFCRQTLELAHEIFGVETVDQFSDQLVKFIKSIQLPVKFTDFPEIKEVSSEERTYLYQHVVSPKGAQPKIFLTKEINGVIVRSFLYSAKKKIKRRVSSQDTGNDSVDDHCILVHILGCIADHVFDHYFYHGFDLDSKVLRKQIVSITVINIDLNIIFFYIRIMA